MRQLPDQDSFKQDFLERKTKMIRKCTDSDFDAILEIINDAAQAYSGVIPADRWNEPYMSSEELRAEIMERIVFWGMEREGQLVGIMGIQDKGEVTLIRHAYVRCRAQKMGVGTRLLAHLQSMTDKPILIGTWAAASWAIAFYENNGYTLVSEQQKNRLLRQYWSIPERQVETSVVLANRAFNPTGNG
jgi:N-acetylglutamate synthase-like GNAT family acetyltransferase